MLRLDTTLTLDREAIISPNLADLFSPSDLTQIGAWVYDGFDRDEMSREHWLRRNEAGMDLAMQVVKEKSFPWPGCSNVAFPLVTIATQQFHSRAYPTLIQGTNVCKMRVLGNDPQGQETSRAMRVGRHISYQLLEEDCDWEEQHDRMTLNYAIVGTAFKKTYYDSIKSCPQGDLVLARDLVLDYSAKSVETAARKTHVYPLSRNDIYTNVQVGKFRNVLDEAWYQSLPVSPESPSQPMVDNRMGLAAPMPDHSTPFTALEQHCRMDLDGDGYAEPYIITIERSSRAVLRIVTGFDREVDIERVGDKIAYIHQRQYFTSYVLIPSPDGSVYGAGFGLLLGPLNESVNSIVNQLIDAGTLSNTAGGFLGRGAKFRGGDTEFSPFRWNRLDANGEDISKSLIPLPVREPSSILFQLLGLLINYTERVSGSTDMQVGENPGQNMKAGTAELLVEQGQKVYSAIFKRHWRSLKEELKKVYKLNAVHMPGRQKFPDGEVYREDYLGDPNRIVPVADPNIVSDSMRLQQAIALKQAAMSTNGYNLLEVEMNYLHALKVESPERFYPGPDKVPPLPNPKVMVEQMKVQYQMEKLKADKMMFIAQLQVEMKLNEAKIHKLEAEAAKAVAEAGGVKSGHMIAAFEAAIGAIKVHNDALHQQAERLMKGMEDEPNADRGGVPGMAGASSNQGPATMALPQAGGLA